METIGMIIQVNDEVVHIERGATDQGYVYKNYDNFESGRGICYIPELSDTTYDRKYFDDNFGDLAVEVFETIDWQSPYSYYDEIMEDRLDLLDDELFDLAMAYDVLFELGLEYDDHTALVIDLRYEIIEVLKEHGEKEQK